MSAPSETGKPAYVSLPPGYVAIESDDRQAWTLAERAAGFEKENGFRIRKRYMLSGPEPARFDIAPEHAANAVDLQETCACGHAVWRHCSKTGACEGLRPRSGPFGLAPCWCKVFAAPPPSAAKGEE